jgi:CHASE2 domain-containing sensor protein
MTAGCAKEPNAPRDLTRGLSAWLLWYLPIALLIAGGAWNRGMVWVWTAAFAVMGGGCAINAMRCGRLHCYVTGPLFLLAAIWCLLSALGVVPLHPNILMLVVVGGVVLAHLAEIPFGRYRKGRIPAATENRR